MIKILLVEDVDNLRRLLKSQLERRGFRVHEAADIKTATRLLHQEDYDALVMDLFLPDGKCIELLEKFPRQTNSRTVIITANPSIPGVVEAIKNGAFNYLEKPVDPELLATQLNKIAEINHLKMNNETMATEIGDNYTFDTMIHESETMDKVITRAKILATTCNTILVQGETGVGKEVMAHALHNHSPRSQEIFLPINCAAIPGDLFETELFGYEKGAFTGAVSSYCGRFIQADKGTLFLDEIGELPLPIQAKLLRILDERRIYRLRSREPVTVDVRLITATNRDLGQEIKAKQFRGDLFFRLQESTVSIPPLRERQEDILPLFRHYVRIYNQVYHKEVKQISLAAEQFLLSHRWEGNIRELKNTVKSTIPFKTNDTIDIDDLSYAIVSKNENPRQQLFTLEEMEGQYIMKVLKICRFNISRAAEVLDITRARVYRKMRQFNLDELVDEDNDNPEKKE